jgi:hypothetical protein
MSHNEKDSQTDMPDVQGPTPDANTDQERISNEPVGDLPTFLTGKRLWIVYASVLLLVFRL